MHGTELSKNLRPLCYEHHVEMENRSSLNGDAETTKGITHGCAEPDCSVHYNIARGYFMLSQNGNRAERDTMPKIRCFLDGAPMYLAEINPQKRSFRLWMCPQCGARRTNEESLAGFASQKVKDVSGESAA